MVERTHTAVATTRLGTLEVLKLSTPAPGRNEVLIHNRFAVLIPFDTYQLDLGYALSPQDYPRVLSFAAAGQVKAVGYCVRGLKEGDHVVTFNFPKTANKALQEYSLLPRTLVTKLPQDYPLHIAASIPDNYVTAMYTVFGGPTLRFPVPTSLVANPPARPHRDLSKPVLVYGAGSSSGQYLVQAFRLAECKHIFAVASSKHHAHLKELGATQSFDYHAPDFTDQVHRAASAAGGIAVAVDCIAVRTSLHALSQILQRGAELALLMPVKDGDTVRDAPDAQMHLNVPDWVNKLFNGVIMTPIYTFRHQEDEFSRENVMPKLLPELLEKGELKPNEVRLIQEGCLLDRVHNGLDLLRNNKIHGEKVVIDLQA